MCSIIGYCGPCTDRKKFAEGFARTIFDGVAEALDIATVEISEPEEIVEKLSGVIEITEKERAIEAVAKAKAENSSLYWILYKIVNK